MDALFERQDAMLRATSMDIVRGFMDRVNWTAPMLCIRGARGVGKSTLLRQYIRLHYGASSREALYCSLDWVYFSRHSVVEVAEMFYKRGGRLLVLDEVHKRPDWSREVKEVHELFPSLQLFLSGSSLLTILDGDADLSRRCRSYDMPGLSFGEYLRFYHGISVPVATLDDVLAEPVDVAQAVNAVCRPLQHFDDYLRHGYYPFYATNPIDYYPLIEQMVNYVVDVELPQQRQVATANCRRIKALINVLAQQVPSEVNMSRLAAVAELQRATLAEYLKHLNDARVLTLLYSDVLSVKKVQKPDKIYLENPNLLYALATTHVQVGTARECFVVNQLGHGHTVEYSGLQGDFRVDGRWTFEVGGERKSFAQIADLPDSRVLADGLEMPHGNKLPLWMVGLLY